MKTISLENYKIEILGTGERKSRKQDMEKIKRSRDIDAQREIKRDRLGRFSQFFLVDFTKSFHVTCCSRRLLLIVWSAGYLMFLKFAFKCFYN